MLTGWKKFVDASGLFANFEKLGYKCKITFLGIRGATVGSFRGAGGMAHIRQHSPHIVLVMLGGNDMLSFLVFPALSCIGAVSSRYGALGYQGSAGWSLPH